MELRRRYNRLMKAACALLLLALPLLSHAADNNALYDAGNAAYAKGKYSDAIDDYQKIVDAGYQSVPVFFNLGNAYFRQGDLPSALLYYEKAHKIAPNDEDVNFNIRFANARTTDKLEAPPEFFVTKWWDNFILFFSVGTLSVLSILVFVGGFLLLVLYLFSNNFIVKRSSFFVGLTAIFVGLVLIFMANRQENFFSDHHQAIIFGNSVTAKNAPDAGGKPLFIVHEGTKVNVLQETEAWMEVELPNGNAGWISVSDAKDI
jgi:tetratricopeptide (TPR) repeat protein